MNFSINKYTILNILFVIIMLIDVRFFYTINVGHIYELFIAVVMVLFMYTFCKKKIGFPNNYLNNYCISTLLIFAFVFIYSMIGFSQSFKETLIGESSNYKMLLVILIFPLSYITYCKNGVRWIMKTLNFFAAVLYVVSVFQAALYNATGRIIFNSLSVTGELPLMYGTLRISLWWFGHLMIVYNFYKAFIADSKRESISRGRHIVLFILGAIAALTVARVRGTTIATVISLIVVVVFSKNTKKGFLKKALIIILIGFVAFGTDILFDFLSSFSEKAVRGYSTTARLYAIEYYWNYFKSHPICGFGFANGARYYSVVHGDGRAAISDVGLFGQLGKYGILILFIYVLPLIRSFKIIHRIWRSQYIKNQVWYLAMAVFVLGTSFTVIAIDQFRMLLWIVYLVVIEFISWADLNHVEINE